MQILTNLNLNQNELQNVVLQPLATAPANPKIGQLYYNSTETVVYQYTGTEWKQVGSTYELPIASTDALGGIRLGTGLSVDATTGIVSVSNEGMAVGSADKLTHPRDIILTGDAEGTGSFDGSANVEIAVTVPGLANKVDAEDGKGLSTHDFTAELKSRLEGIEAGAQVNVQADWNATEGDALILNKPTALTQFDNDANFIDNTVSNLTNYYLKTETYTQAEIDQKIGALATIKIEVVTLLPESGSSNVIYLVPKSSLFDSNSYDEYLWTGTAFEKIGDTEIDLSNYLQKTGDASETTVTFIAPEEPTTLVSGDTVGTLIGKIDAYIKKLHNIAFTGSYNDLIDIPTAYPHLAIEQVVLEAGQVAVTTDTTFESSTISNVAAYDNVTGEQLFVDWTLDVDKTITVEIATPYVNNIIINISYLAN